MSIPGRVPDYREFHRALSPESPLWHPDRLDASSDAWRVWLNEKLGASVADGLATGGANDAWLAMAKEKGLL